MSWYGHELRFNATALAERLNTWEREHEDAEIIDIHSFKKSESRVVLLIHYREEGEEA